MLLYTRHSRSVDRSIQLAKPSATFAALGIEQAAKVSSDAVQIPRAPSSVWRHGGCAEFSLALPQFIDPRSRSEPCDAPRSPDHLVGEGFCVRPWPYKFQGLFCFPLTPARIEPYADVAHTLVATAQGLSGSNGVRAWRSCTVRRRRCSIVGGIKFERETRRLGPEQGGVISRLISVPGLLYKPPHPNCRAILPLLLVIPGSVPRTWQHQALRRLES